MCVSPVCIVCVCVSPEKEMQAEWCPPHATNLTLLLVNVEITRGALTLPSYERPNLPQDPLPQEYTTPWSFSAML